MKPKHSFFVTVGIPSLFLVFSVLVLSVLSLLTLGSSRSFAADDLIILPRK